MGNRYLNTISPGSFTVHSLSLALVSHGFYFVTSQQESPFIQISDSFLHQLRRPCCQPLQGPASPQEVSLGGPVVVILTLLHILSGSTSLWWKGTPTGFRWLFLWPYTILNISNNASYLLLLKKPTQKLVAQNSICFVPKQCSWMKVCETSSFLFHLASAGLP